ncbi:CoA transferase [Cellulomonas chitinilytica]|uniref:CoA transferase n=1 Tax=Cellulomonas chitinilytica TaxID=398759 RepID=A0A919U4R2_9CELL|nr:CoA transferase [Cellulomonas chitinilytica]GIG23409.1 CoA transferase [Cellulomonas chitinilytica]
MVLVPAWAALGGDPALPSLVRSTGDTGLGSVLAVGALALGAVGAQRLAAEELRTGSAPDGPVVLDARHVGIAFRSERFLRVDGHPAGAGFAPLSRFTPAADGWVRLHANYPHHLRALHDALGADPLAVIGTMSATDVEDAVVAAGGVAAAVRTEQEWAASDPGAAVRALPVLRLARVGDGRPRAPRLDGLRVLDLTRVIAGPVGTRTLASYGADVLRLDSPRLPEDPAALLDTGPGKRHARLDLATSDGRERFEDLLDGADVLVQGYRPGALDRFGLSSAALAERRPGLVVVTLSAWGTDGPWAGRRGFDSIVQAATGIADVTRADDGTPGALPAQALDHAAGHLVAAAVMRAVTQTGGGGTWHAHLSLAQLATWLLGAPRSTLPPTAPAPDADPYLVDLDSPTGTVTLVAPPGSPVWRHGPVPSGYDESTW